MILRYSIRHGSYWSALPCALAVLALSLVAAPLARAQEAQAPQLSSSTAATEPLNDSLAQPIVAPTTPEEAEQLMRQLYPEETPVAPEQIAADGKSEQNPLKITWRGKVSAIYDDNIFIASAHETADFVFTVAPGVSVGYGDFREREQNFLLFDYSASALFFAAHDGEDAIEQQGALDGQWRLARLTVGLKFRFQDLSGPDVDVGNRTKRHLYETEILNNYTISEKTYVEANFQNKISDYETRLDSVEWIARFWWNYRANPKVTIGAGVTAGLLDAESSASQTYEQALGRVIYFATEKLSFQVDGGVELRQLDQGERVNPVFTVAATYLPFEATRVQLSAYRRVQSSALLAGENYTLTGASIELRRSLRSNIDLVLAGGYENSDYQAVTQQRREARDDDYFFIRPSLQVQLASTCKLELFYLNRANHSTLGRSGFRNSQTGMELTLAY